MNLNFLIFDGAKYGVETFSGKVSGAQPVSLFKGDGFEYLAQVGPYFLSKSTAFEIFDLVRSVTWGNAATIYFHSPLAHGIIMNHFRKFLLVKTEDNLQLYFRFYDPRVLKIFLPTCDKQQIIEFFGPVESFIVEGETKEEAIRFWHENGELKQEILPVEAVFGEEVPGKTINT
jgi:hypothetical protein